MNFCRRLAVEYVGDAPAVVHGALSGAVAGDDVGGGDGVAVDDGDGADFVEEDNGVS